MDEIIKFIVQEKQRGDHSKRRSWPLALRSYPTAINWGYSVPSQRSVLSLATPSSYFLVPSRSSEGIDRSVDVLLIPDHKEMKERNDGDRDHNVEGGLPLPPPSALEHTYTASTAESLNAPDDEIRMDGNNESAPAHTQLPLAQGPLQPPANLALQENPISPPEEPSTQTASEPSFAQLAFRTFETYMNETRAEQIVPPLQEMICGYGEGLARLAQSTHNHLQLPQLTLSQSQAPVHGQSGQFLEPIALRRHIHSTPQIRRSPVSALSAIHPDENICVSDSDEDEPPPAGLEILDVTRSRSTPLTTSENSAFGTILRTNSHRIHDGNAQSNGGRGSAFSLRPYAMMKATSRSRSNEQTARPVIFNPIIDEDEILTCVDADDALGEMTSIEVTNVPRPKEESLPKKKSAASRAAKFLTDVRNLRISSGNGNKRQSVGGRSRPRDGRENPAQPPSVSSDEHSRSSSAAATTANASTASQDGNDTVAVVVETSTSSSKVISSEGAVASKEYVQNSKSETTIDDRVCIQVNDNIRPYSSKSPEPLSQSFASHSQDSPESSTFSPSISNSSGRVSHGTSTSNSSNARSYSSRLSAISETDREVANVNHRQRDRRLQGVGEQIELSLSSDRTFRSGDLNCSVSAASPDSQIRRDGATVRADRFFDIRKESNRFRNLPPFIKRSCSAQSPTAGSCAASVNTNSSTGSDEPPKIVSYIDRKQVSDLSSLHRHYLVESSSPRADHQQEVREASPSDEIQAEHSEVVFAGAHATTIDICNVPRPHWPAKASYGAFGRKNRSLPPRSPGNKLFSSITPPRVGSPAYTISPPRQIFDHRPDLMATDLSRPYTMAPVSSQLPSTELVHAPNQGSQVVRLSPNCDYYNLKPAARGLSPVYGHQSAGTYEESSIEILKTDSKDDNSIPLVTPDKGTPSP